MHVSIQDDNLARLAMMSSGSQEHDVNRGWPSWKHNFAQHVHTAQMIAGEDPRTVLIFEQGVFWYQALMNNISR